MESKQGESMGSTSPIRLGVLGCGSVTDFGHVPAIERIRHSWGLCPVAFFDPVISKAQKYASKFEGAVAADSYDDFFGQKLDAVVICSPMPKHHENVLLCAKHGVHVLCEKPIAENEDQAEEMIKAMEATGKGFFIAFVYRFSPIAQTLKHWFHSGVIGDVKSIRMIYNWNLHGQWVQDEAGKWIESPMWRGRMLEGGPMIDCGVHMIDLIRWMSGEEIVDASGHGAWVSNYEAADHVYAHLESESGIHGMVEMSFTYGHTAKFPAPQFTYELIGTGGVAKYDRNGYLLEARNGEGILKGPSEGEKNFDGMWHAFCHYIRTGESGDLASPRDALEATRIALETTPRRIPVAVAVKK